MSNRTLGEIIVYTHFFQIKTKDERVKTACRNTAEVFSEKKWIKEKNRQGDWVNRQVTDKIYATLFEDGVTFQFHNGQLKDIITQLRKFDLTIDDLEVTTKTVYTPSKIEYKLKKDRILRDYQDNAKGFANATPTNNDHWSKLIAMPTGSGKALSNPTKVLTPSGWRSMGSLRVGDKVIAGDGTASNIIGVYPQGIVDAYKVTFTDGRSANAASGDHLWKVHSYEFNNTDLPEEVCWKIQTTTDLIDHVKRNRSSLSIPLYTPIDSPDIDLPIDPYSLGTLLLKKRVLKVKEFALYTTASLSQRYALIQGIMDVLGDVTSTGCITMTSSRLYIARYLQVLIRSIGASAVIRKTKTGYWSLYIVTDRPKELFKHSIHRGQVRVPNPDKEPQRLGIASIEPIKEQNSTCIAIDHPSQLFVIENYIVTHNTVTSCGIAAENKQRWMIGILPKYKDKWAKDIVDNLDLKPKEVMVIDKTAGLRGIIDHCKVHGTKKLQPVLVITLTTLRAFIESYQNDPEECVKDYGCTPFEMWGILDIGMFSVDEAHEHIYTVFLIAMHLHGPRFIAMSGTMMSEDPFVDRIQNVIFPAIKRFTEVKMEKYIDCEFLCYYIRPNLRPKIRYQAFGRPDYSHVELEKSIMKNRDLLEGFLTMCGDIVEYGYVEQRTGSDKGIMYVGTVDMANIMVKYLKSRFPSVNVNRYVGTENDLYQDLLTADFTVSTIQSAGTAVDIPDLICNICTTLISSGKSNLQVLGRLRKLGDKKVTMYLPYCAHIQKHTQYMAYRYELFKDKVKSIKTFNISKVLG